MSEEIKAEQIVQKVELTEEEKAAKKEEKKEKARLEKAAKDAKKAERLAARQAKGAADAGDYVKDPNDPSADKFGDMELCRNQCDPEDRFTKIYVAVKDLEEAHAGQEVRIRGRVHNSRAKGKMAFFVIREGYGTVQVVLSVSETVSKGMVTYASKIPKESIVEIIADVIKPDQAVAGCSQQVELSCKEFWCVNKSVPMLPFQLEDASRVVLD